MLFADYHIHTNFSPDAADSMEDMIQKGIALGLKEMAFTDHVDLDFSKDKYKTMEDYKKCYPVFRRLQEKYKDSIDLLLGIENGYQSHVENRIDDLLKSTPFDFSLLSIHAIDNLCCSDKEFFGDVTEETATTRYLEAMLKAISDFHNYDALAHLTFLARYLESKNLPYNIYSQYFDEIFRLLIAGGKALEVNTSGYRFGLNAPIPDWTLLQAYYNAGGRLITLGSDAHKKEDLALHFNSVQQGLESIGFTHLCTYRQRNMILQPLHGTKIRKLKNLMTKPTHKNLG